ncbi:MAG TPA: SDR family NAD(P)-dependent oxidoreductase [Anaerolineales bacterium]|jgi:NAD(P)-dependent dehydrogenase (short-subunit alcohol dehydrogenase family)
MSQIEGKIALVTGGGKGIGQAIALALAAEGASLVVIGRSPAALDETRALIAEHGGKTLAFICDIADKNAVRVTIEQVRSQLGPVEILVNNAGITYDSKFQETSDELWEGIIQTNVNGTFYCCKAVLPDMIKKRWGRIITISSIAGLYGIPYSVAYSASKHAQVGLTRSLALEVARYNITVNALCPGFVETAMLAEAIDYLVKVTRRTPEEALADLLKLSGQTRVVTPTEVAAEVVRLANLETPGETGQAITIL